MVKKSKMYACQFPRIGLYMWDIRTTQIEDHEGLLVFFNRTRYQEITIIKDNVVQVKNLDRERKPVVRKFDLRTLCSNTQGNGRNGTDLFTRKDLSLAGFPPVIKDILGRKVSDYIGNNYSFDLEALCKPESPTVVIVLPIYQKLIFDEHSEEEVRTPQYSASILKYIPLDPTEHSYYNKMGTEYDLAVNLSRWAEALEFEDCFYSKLVRVPPLEIFQPFDGRLVAEDTCSICLEEFTGKNISDRKGNIIRKTRCSHYFHGGCIGRWVWREQSCPLCRSPLSGSVPPEPANTNAKLSAIWSIFDF